MSAIGEILLALEERTIARKVGIPHDEARMRYPLRSNTVGSIAEFFTAIGDYYNHHSSQCVSRGGTMSSAEAKGHAKEALEREYRRRRGNIVSAYNDAHDGTNGGLRVVLDTIAESLKAESVERYMRDVLDRYVAPNEWAQKVEIIRQLIAQCGMNLSTSIQADQPERYAQDYAELIRAYVTGLQQTSSVFRRF